MHPQQNAMLSSLHDIAALILVCLVREPLLRLLPARASVEYHIVVDKVNNRWKTPMAVICAPQSTLPP